MTMAALNVEPQAGRATVRPMRLVLVDDHPLMLEGVASILRGTVHAVVATLTDSTDLLPLLRHEQVDVVTLDIGMPKLNGLELARKIRLQYPKIKIIFITQQTDKAYIRSAIEAGGSGFIAKHSAGRQLLDAIATVASNRQYISPGLLDTEGGLRFALQDLQARKDNLLSPRQREVLQLIAEGKTVKEIASTLDISVKTVEFHKQGLVDSLGVRTTAELTRYAIAHGLTFL